MILHCQLWLSLKEMQPDFMKYLRTLSFLWCFLGKKIILFLFVCLFAFVSNKSWIYSWTFRKCNTLWITVLYFIILAFSISSNLRNWSLQISCVYITTDFPHHCSEEDSSQCWMSRTRSPLTINNKMSTSEIN